MSEATPLLPVHSFMAWTGTLLHFYLTHIYEEKCIQVLVGKPEGQRPS
jgi:hypothetical protein